MVKEKVKNLALVAGLLLIFFSICLGGCGTISDGEYTASVLLSGGSGRAYIESPCSVTVKDGKATARIVWSSPNYDYMIVDGETYYPVNTDGNSEFEIPITLDKEMQVQADTTAMSKPHLIEYTLLFTLEKDNADGTSENGEQGSDATGGQGSGSNAANGQGDGSDADGSQGDGNAGNNQGDGSNSSVNSSLNPPSIEGLTYLSTDENVYAQCYRIHRYNDGFIVISVDDGRNYLLVPEGQKDPENAGQDIVVLEGKLDRIYLAASAAMCHFDSLSCVDRILLSGIEEEDWYIEAAASAMKDGTLKYGGKYSAPDYEQIVMMDIDLAVESTMILHVPKVQEQLEELGVPVFIDRSSYEEEPFGRCEWIKVYGVLTGEEEKAESAFESQKAQVEQIEDLDVEGKSVVLFYLNSNHQVVTRTGNDYFAKMIEMAGGEYLAPIGDDGGASQMTISIEAFYEYASDADILIYNATIESVPESLEELMGSDVTFKDFKAFQEGNVWYTDKSLYQFSDKTGTIISDLAVVIAGEQEETDFFHKLK